MLRFLEETVLAGYSELVESGQRYHDDAGKVNDKMQEFAMVSSQIRENTECIKEAIEAVNIAMSESAEGITNVAQTAVELTNNMEDVHEEADGNMEIAEKLHEEVGHFKLN